MTRHEMRKLGDKYAQQAENYQRSRDMQAAGYVLQVTAAIWSCSAEICERLEALADKPALKSE